MLVKLKIKNFLSFHKETEIDFRKIDNCSLLPQNILEETGILKGAMFVGGNGTGKSSILQAIKMLLDMMFKEKDMPLAIYVCLINGDAGFSIEYTFEIQKEEICYNISYEPDNETLGEKLSKSGEILFERTGYKASSYFDANKVNYDKGQLKEDGLFLRTLYFNGALQYSEVLKQWIMFLKNSRYVNASSTPQSLNNSFYSDKYFEENGTDKINTFLKHYHYGQTIYYGDSILIENKESKIGRKVVTYKRDGENFSIPSIAESLGNRNLVRVLIDYLYVIENNGMLVIDEFSSEFHNELEALLIKHFMKEAKKSQIIFVSHSTNLLSNSILRPDQEYAVDYISGEGSRVNRFSNEQPRNSQNIEKMYNSGVFSGKPVYEEG